MKRKKSPFFKLRHSVGLGRHKDAENFPGISKTTLHRWDNEGSPAWAERLLRYRDRWDCTAYGPEWAGWRFSQGRLVNRREHMKLTPERLRHWRRAMDRLSDLEAAQTRPRPACPLRPLWRPVAVFVKRFLLYVKI